MSGDPQAARARLSAGVPALPWSIRVERMKERWRRSREETLEVMVRMKAEERRARQAGPLGGRGGRDPIHRRVC